jgi:hypothetical protein
VVTKVLHVMSDAVIGMASLAILVGFCWMVLAY